MKDIDITQNIFSDELKKHIFHAFGEHAIRVVGVNGVAEEPISFEIKQEEELIGCVVVQMFWGNCMSGSCSLRKRIETEAMPKN